MRSPAPIPFVGAAVGAAFALFVVPGTAAAVSSPTPVPHVGAVSPIAGLPGGGNVVMVRGHQLQTVAAATFGSARTTKITHLSPSRIAVTAPAHSAGVVNIHLVSKAGKSTTSAQYSYGPPPHLIETGPTVIDPDGGLTHVSCPSSTWCTAIDGHGNAVQGSGSSWSAPEQVDPRGLNGVSCASRDFCVAIEARGHVERYQSGKWSDPERIDTNNNFLADISCPTATRCVASDLEGRVFTWNGSSWSSAHKVASTITRIDCPNANMCAAISTDHLYVLRNGIWRTSTLPHTSTGYISCLRSNYCIASFKNGFAYLVDGLWSPLVYNVHTNPEAEALIGPSCISDNVCIGRDKDQDEGTSAVVALNGAAAKFVHSISGGILALSCVTNVECVVVTDDSTRTITVNQ